jgi:hypothetical protein
VRQVVIRHSGQPQLRVAQGIDPHLHALAVGRFWIELEAIDGRGFCAGRMEVAEPVSIGVE